VSFTHAQTFAVHVKFSLPAPVGHVQLTVVHPLVTLPHALPRALTGQVAGAQQTLGFGVVLQTVPAAQLHVSVAPQPLLNVPHASPPSPGPPGTLVQSYGAPVGLLQAHVPTAPATAVEQTLPAAHAQLIVPPTPFGSALPQLPA
jgi:hypothetical protein